MLRRSIEPKKYVADPEPSLPQHTTCPPPRSLPFPSWGSWWADQAGWSTAESSPLQHSTAHHASPHLPLSYSWWQAVQGCVEPSTSTDYLPTTLSPSPPFLWTVVEGESTRQVSTNFIPLYELCVLSGLWAFVSNHSPDCQEVTVFYSALSLFTAANASVVRRCCRWRFPPQLSLPAHKQLICLPYTNLNHQHNYSHHCTIAP